MNYLNNLGGAGLGSEPYDECCIYGGDDTAKLTLDICEGCIYQIQIFVDKLLDGTEQIRVTQKNGLLKIILMIGIFFG